ncbi:MAG: hypothetical protein EHM78_20705 [Myxococcaceae bacterium]|nr:MAG: hypothetical protein EHM78_20705 [Myxococcaceae bacterium]
MAVNAEPREKSGADSVGIQHRVLAALHEPSAYPHPAIEVRVIRTHISVIYLAGAFAYKVKREV